MSDGTDPRDKILQSVMPMVMAPVYGYLPPLAVGSKRLIAASDGIYLEARTPVLWACVKAQDLPMPYGDQVPFLKLRFGREFVGALTQFMQDAKEVCPDEHAAVVVANEDQYHLQKLAINASTPVSVTYSQADIDDQSLVFDIHSHGDLDAFFSHTDDISDLARQGPYIAIVLGRCRDLESVQGSVRLVCAPYLIPLDWSVLQTAGRLDE